MARPGKQAMSMADRPDDSTEPRSSIIFSWWNLLLLVPLLMLITSWYNFDRPHLGGMPFFYWYQLAFVFVGVICVAIVYAKTKHLRGTRGSDPVPPANPDEGDQR